MSGVRRHLRRIWQCPCSQGRWPGPPRQPLFLSLSTLTLTKHKHASNSIRVFANSSSPLSTSLSRLFCLLTWHGPSPSHPEAPTESHLLPGDLLISPQECTFVSPLLPHQSHPLKWPSHTLLVLALDNVYQIPTHIYTCLLL